MVDFPWLSLLIFFLFIGLKSLESLSFKLQIYFLVDLVRFFFAVLLHLKQKKSFQILTPYISRTKQPRKKNELKQKDATFIYNPQDLRIRNFTTFFFQVFDLVKIAKKQRGYSKRNVKHVNHVIRVTQFEIFKSKSYSWKTH